MAGLFVGINNKQMLVQPASYENPAPAFNHAGKRRWRAERKDVHNRVDIVFDAANHLEQPPSRNAFAGDIEIAGLPWHSTGRASHAVIHTWSQTLTDHFHLHCLVPGGVLTPDGQWKQARTKYLFRAQSMAALLKKNSTSAVCDCKDRIAGIDIAKCPHCGAGRMVTIRQLPRLPPPDTS